MTDPRLLEIELKLNETLAAGRSTSATWTYMELADRLMALKEECKSDPDLKRIVKRLLTEGFKAYESEPDAAVAGDDRTPPEGS